MNHTNEVYAEVIIPLALPKNYTWTVPALFKDTVKRGCRVEVSLGKNKRYAGLVKELHQQKPVGFDPKPILQVLDAHPILNDFQLKLWEWIASYYMCSEGEVMAAALPAHFKLSSETILIYNEAYGGDLTMLDNEEFVVAEALEIKHELKLTEVQDLLDSQHVYPVVKRLIDAGVCIVGETLRDTYVQKKETYVTLEPAYSDEEKLSDLLNNWAKAPKQLELLLAFIHLSKTSGEVTKAELLKKSGASDAQLKGLVEKKIIRVEKRAVDRFPNLSKEVVIDFELTAAQEAARQQLKSVLEEKQVCLLHGVTSSGKTLLYIKAIEDYINEGKQVLYLLPEIALTSQVIRRLQKHFGGNIAIYHSKFNQNERMEIWRKVATGETRIVLGARSSLFLPFRELGLIIVDEEHDGSYKQQDPAPRYNARDAAVFYASLFEAKVILGSATPSLESYFNAVNGKYGLAELLERFGNLELPKIELVDTKPLLFKQKEKTILTPALEKEINESLQAGQQVILFQNRRGYSPYQVCQVCGWIPHCRYCDVTLTFHKNSNKLHCHYCGTVYPPIHTCLACGNDRFAQRNFGTEKIEEQLTESFPKAKVARMDVDSVRGKQAHDDLIQLFEQRRIDLLVGTQMVVKGLDFDTVGLVGILDADSLLSFADFRVNERAFQLMEQVSGRAGRKEKQGLVLIQVANMNHPVLQLVQRHDYRSFYQAELEGRKRFFYPPYSRLIHLTFRHKMKEIAEEAAAIFADRLKAEFGQFMVGPAEPIVGRVRSLYLMELLFKLPKDTHLVQDCKKKILLVVAELHGEKKFRNVVVIPDVDVV